MKQFTETYILKITPFQKHCFEVLENVYRIKPSSFVSSAIEEKLKRGIPKLREEKSKIRLPF